MDFKLFKQKANYAAVGGLVLDPIGLAAGVIGMGKGKTNTDIIWVCKSCGHQTNKPK